MGNTDLHIHSCYSNDGEFTPIDIVNRCLVQKVDCFSITDHNSVKGINEAISQAQRGGIHFIPGIEIDCNYEGTDLHLLGYQINWKSNDFLELEEDIFSKEMDSFAEKMINLNRLGFVIDTDSVRRKANGKPPTGELIAEVMLSDKKYDSPLLLPYMKGGNRSDMPYINFYLDYFAQGKPAFAQINFMSYQNAVEIIKDNGGIPIVAHPGLNFKGKENTVEQLLNHGAEGLEIFNNYHTEEQINYFGTLTRKRGVMMTCGSDFHGKTKPLINIGQYNFDCQLENDLSVSIQQLSS